MSPLNAQLQTARVVAMPSLAETVEHFALGEDDSRRQAVEHCNRLLADRRPEERIEWALSNLPSQHALSSSFGVQAAVSLHMVNRIRPGLPVIFVDTGYLFPETYQFVDELTTRLDLNLKIFRSSTSPAWQEARHGRRWEQGLENLNEYNRENKVEPMQRALRELNVGTWFAGLRRSQSSTRATVEFISWTGGERCKVHPIADWSDRDVHRYLKAHNLPYHPLWEKGYVSIGDMHSTRALHEVDNIDETRFAGLKRECGLHEINLSGL